MTKSIDWRSLARDAESARDLAYAPYSEYRVGAALLTRSGRVFLGANIENASYGLCVCAERHAVAAAVLAGERDWAALAVATQGPVPGSPCGMCRQVLAEFVRDLPIGLVGGGVVRKKTSLRALLPEAFRGAHLPVKNARRPTSR